MIEKNPLFDGAGIHFAIFAEMDRRLGKAVGLPAGVQSVHVGFVFLRAGVRVHDGCDDGAKDREEQQCEGKNGGVTDSPNLPLLAPALERPSEGPVQVGEAEHDDDGEKREALGDVVHDVMAHLVSHDRLDFFG